MNIDLMICKEILEKLATIYPYSATSIELDELLEVAGSEEIFAANLIYLDQHRLIVSGLSFNINRHHVFRGETRITERGIDYVREDGGLSAMIDKSSVSYQLHEALLSEMLRQIQESPDTDRDKVALSSQLRALPAETIKHLYMKLLDQGVSTLPNVFQLIQTLLRQG